MTRYPAVKGHTPPDTVAPHRRRSGGLPHADPCFNPHLQAKTGASQEREVRCTIDPVSILTRSRARMREQVHTGFNPHPPRRAGATTSLPEHIRSSHRPQALDSQTVVLVLPEAQLPIRVSVTPDGSAASSTTTVYSENFRGVRTLAFLVTTTRSKSWCAGAFPNGCW